TASTPPSAPNRGERFVVPNAAQGDWSGSDGQIVLWDGSGWHGVTPQEGWAAFSLEGDVTIRFDGSTWVESAADAMPDVLGLNATADTTNRLSVAAPATLLTHDGAGHQVKVNKALPADTASLLFQTGFSGRAEMGTSGNDAFSIKVSDDGSNWTTAVSFDGATGSISGAAVQSGPTDTTGGKLALAENTYGPGTLLGAVSQTGGTPTGAAIERGANADGQYVRFADGTQICWSPEFTVDVTIAAGAIFRSAEVNWTFPVAFYQPPALSQGRQDDAVSYWTVPGSTAVNSASACAMSYQSTTGRLISLLAIGRWF
uniref:DUF2793 domain-containing protein n=1 Tax=Pseudooctadecabacter sp. TaxID=1966338 RepID=UPI0035C87624